MLRSLIRGEVLCCEDLLGRRSYVEHLIVDESRCTLVIPLRVADRIRR